MSQHRLNRRTLLRALGSGAIARPALTTAAQVPTPESTTTDILMYPAHGTATASPTTTISFRNVPPDILGDIRVTGSTSGGHSGVMRPHADGQGVSFVPDARYEPGELVTVESALPLHGTGSGSASFRIAIPAPRPQAPAKRITDDPASPPREFQSRPDLRPPVINVTTPATQAQPGHIFVAPKVPDGQNGAMILDESGELVWYSTPASDASVCNDLAVQEWHGQPVLTWWEGVTPVGYGYGHFVIANTAYERLAEVQAGNGFVGADLHEFVLTPRGTALCLLYNPVRWSLTDVGGPANGTAMDNIVQEIEVETGNVLFEWHALDHIDIAETYRRVSPNATRPLDYVHLNSIDEDHDGNLIVSGRNTHAIYKIDRTSGEVMWRLNGRRSNFRMGEHAPFVVQHDARRLSDGTLSLFDNATEQPDEGEGGIASRGLVLELDMDTMQANVAREYVHETGIVSVSQGNMQTLPNGNVFIGWGSAPVFSEFGPDGDLRFNGRFPSGVMSYRAFRFPWTGRPATPPDVAAVDGLIYASWNGATDVATWRVLAGPRPDALEPATSAARSGFETVISGPEGEPWIAVQALDARGHLLGTSDPIRA